MFFNSFLAYFVNLTNFLVTKYTSALTLQVLGNAKGIFAVVVSVLCFRNPVTVYSVLGYCVTVFGVVLYSHAKKVSKRAEALRKMGMKHGVADLEQPKSPFGSSAENGALLSDALSAGERQALLIKAQAGDLKGDGLNGVNSRALSAALSSQSSDRIMARGFSSIFEA